MSVVWLLALPGYAVIVGAAAYGLRLFGRRAGL